MTIATARPAVAPAGPNPSQPVPLGAARMQSWFIGPDGRKVRTPIPVPVDDDDNRTPHRRHTCPRSACLAAEWLPPGATRFCPEHGVALLAPANERRKALAMDALRLHGTSSAPWLLLGVVAAAMAVVVLCRMSAWQVIPTVPAAAGLSYVVTRAFLTVRELRAGRIERGQRDGKKLARIRRHAHTAAMVGATAGGFVVAAAAIDPGTLAGRLLWPGLLLVWAVAAYPWWRRAEQRRRIATQPAPIPVTPSPAVLDAVQEQAVVTWAARIGHAQGPLAGTELVDFHRLQACPAGAAGRVRRPNWTATVRAVVAGSINMREPRDRLLGRIAAAYGCSYGDVAFVADPNDLSIAHVRVQPDNALAEVRPYPGPATANNWAKGTTAVGRFDDATPIRYQWYGPGGAVHTLISGCTGSGKSELVALLLISSLHSGGLVLDWVGDPQGGQSYGALKGAVDWFARDKTEIVYLLLAATKEMYRRNDHFAAANQKTWKPTREFPLLVLTLDEAQSYLDEPIVRDLVEKLIGMGRKCGIKVRIITQVPYAYALGGSTYIREQLMSGQAFTFRAATATAGLAAAERNALVDPTLLPDKWGANTCNPGDTTAGLMFVQGINGRDNYGRGDYTGDDLTGWLTDPAGAATCPGVFSPAAQAMSGPLWAGRHARHAAALAAGRDDATLLPGGRAVELINTAAQTANLTPPTTPAQWQPQPTGRSRDHVLAAARTAAAAHPNGHAERKAITALTPGMADGTRDRIIGDLIAAGELIRVHLDGKARPGLFALTTAGRPGA